MPPFMTQPLTSLNAGSGSRNSARKFWQGRSVFTGLRKSVLEVSQMGRKEGWLWDERYHAGEGNTVKPGGAYGYCEYPAILIRAIVSNPAVFPESRRAALGS